MIPEALGGALTSRALLCVSHNNTLGHEVDAELCRQLAPLANMIGLAPKNSTPPIRVRVSSPDDPSDEAEHLRNADGTLHRSRPKFSMEEQDGRVTIHAEARSRKELRQLLEGMKRKEPKLANLDVDGFVAGAAQKTVPYTGPVGFYLEDFGGEVFFRAIAKIAVDFAILRGVDTRWLGDVVQYILGAQAQASDECVTPSYSVASIGREREGCHTIALLGDPRSGSLAGYVELFGVVRCVVQLSTTYSGPAVAETYGYDLNSLQPFDPRLSSWPIRSEYGGWDVVDFRNALASYSAFAERGSIIAASIREAFAACGRPGDLLPVADVLAAFQGIMEPHLLRWISAAASTRRVASGNEPCACGSDQPARECCDPPREH